MLDIHEDEEETKEAAENNADLYQQFNKEEKITVISAYKLSHDEEQKDMSAAVDSETYQCFMDYMRQVSVRKKKVPGPLRDSLITALSVKYGADLEELAKLFGLKKRRVKEIVKKEQKLGNNEAGERLARLNL